MHISAARMKEKIVEHPAGSKVAISRVGADQRLQEEP
jgi:hypothetical protein